MKKWATSIFAGVLALSLAACGQSGGSQPAPANNEPAPAASENTPAAEPVTLKVGATVVPHAEILEEVVKPELEKEGINLEIVTFQDYVLPNTQLYEKELDANYFQHIPWLESTNQEQGYDLTYVAGIHIEPMGIYSNKEKAYTDISALPEGAKVAITNGQGEHGRVLALLERAGLIKLNEGVGINGTTGDIVEKKIELVELAPAMLPHAIEDAQIDVAVINANFALQAGLNPVQDSIFLESGENNPFVNVLATRQENKDDEAIKKLAEVMTSPAVKEYIDQKYDGAVLFVGQLQ